MQIRIKKLRPDCILPQYQTEHSAGMDLCATVDEPVTIKPMQRLLVPCGFSMELPFGYEAQIRARSGLALKNGISLPNGIGTIDADYRGEIGVILINLGSEDFVINNGDRIAQMVITQYTHAQLSVVDDLSDTARGSGGFGSTGTV
jgi:dUTP pyrophosphatase